MLTPKQVAAECGLGVRAIYGAIKRGELPAYRLCGRLRIDLDDFKAWKAENEAKPRPTVKPSQRRRAAPKNSLRALLGTDSAEEA